MSRDKDKSGENLTQVKQPAPSTEHINKPRQAGNESNPQQVKREKQAFRDGQKKRERRPL